MAMPTGTTHVDAPAFVRPPGGLFEVVPPIAFGASTEVLGVTYESSSCIKPNFVSLILESCLETDEKDFDGLQFQSSEPAFYVYAGSQCTLFANDFSEFETRASERLERGEQTLVERALWESVFPERATDITPAGGAVDPVTGLGLLEEWAGELYSAQVIVHAGKRLNARLVAEQLVSKGQLETGSLYINGAGYVSLDGPLEPTAPIAAPVAALGAKANTGAFAAGTYFWKVTALNEFGETIGSNEVTATLVANDRQTITWAAITGATGYKVYRGTVTNTQNVLVATVGAVTSLADTGASEASPASVPVTNTTAGEVATEAEDGEVWMYITGAIVLRRGEPMVKSVSKPETNELIALAERAYLPLVDCIVGAIRINLE